MGVITVELGLGVVIVGVVGWVTVDDASSGVMDRWCWDVAVGVVGW